MGFEPFNAAMFEHFLAMAPSVGFARPRASVLAANPEAVRDRIAGEAQELSTYVDYRGFRLASAAGGLARDALGAFEAGDTLTAIFVDLGKRGRERF